MLSLIVIVVDLIFDRIIGNAAEAERVVVDDDDDDTIVRRLLFGFDVVNATTATAGGSTNDRKLTQNVTATIIVDIFVMVDERR